VATRFRDLRSSLDLLEQLPCRPGRADRPNGDKLFTNHYLGRSGRFRGWLATVGQRRRQLGLFIV